MSGQSVYKVGIVISADASGVKPGVAATREELASIGPAAAAAQTKMQQLIATATGLHTGSANNNQRAWAGALAAEGLALDNLRAKYNPLFAVIQQYKAAQVEIRTAHAMGALSADEMTAAMQRQRQAALASIDAIKGRNAALVQGNGMGGHNFAATNAMFQLQDIGMTAAMGMSPAMIALQQGSQLAGNFAGMGFKQVGATMAGAFTQLLSPVSLASVAITGLTAAAIQYFMKSEDATDKANQALEEHGNLIRRLRDAYGSAAVGAQEYAGESKKILGQDTADSIKSYRTILDQSAKDMLSGMKVPAGDFEGKTYLIGLAQSAIEQLKQSVAAGTPDVQTFIEKLIEIENHPAVPLRIKELAEELRKAASEGIDAQRALQKLLDTQRNIGNAASRSYGTQGTAFEADQQFRQLELQRERETALAELNARSPAEKSAAARLREENRFDTRESPDTRIMRIDQAGTLAAAQAEKQLVDAKRDRARSISETLDSQKLELSLMGKTISETEALRMQYQLTADLKAEAAKNGVAVDQDELRLIEEKARAYGVLAEQIAATNMIRDQQDQAQTLQTELSLVGAGEVARRKALAVLQAEQDLKRQGIASESSLGNLYKRNAELLAQGTLALEKQTDAWNRYRSAGESAIDTIFDGLGNLDSPKDILKNLAGDVGNFAMDMMVKNPLKNALLGTNYGTLSDLLTGGNKQGGILSSLMGSTGMMTVNAATVMINGGVSGGLGGIMGALTGSGTAANNNQSTSLLGQIFKSAGVTKTGIPLSEVVTGNGMTAKVAADYAPRFQGLLNDLKSAGYNISSLGEGGYSFRNVAGTNNLSKHSFGEAIDINPRQNPWSNTLQTDLPSNVNQLAQKNGLTWGGTWNKPDTMHFQVDKSVSNAALGLDKVADSANGATGSIGALGNGLGEAGKGLNQFGGDLGKFGQSLQSALSGGNSGVSGLLGSFTSYGISAFNSSPQFAAAAMSGIGGLWSEGGYTGPGGIYEPRGIVHAGEVVWSQRDVARAGGPQVVDAMRLGRRGYAAGGIVDAMPLPSFATAANSNAAPASSAAALPSIIVNVDNPRGDRDIEDAIDRGVARGIKNYRKNLGADIERIKRRPKVRGQLK